MGHGMAGRMALGWRWGWGIEAGDGIKDALEEGIGAGDGIKGWC